MTAKKKDEEAPVEAEGQELPDSDTIETGSEPGEVHVSDRERMPTDTAFDEEPSPTAAAAMEEIRKAEDEARAKQEEEAAADFERRKKIDQEKVARDDELKAGFGTPGGTQDSEKHEVELGDCLVCGKPVTADQSYMKHAGGITHMHECAKAYAEQVGPQNLKDRDVSHEPNEVRHPDLAQRHGSPADAGEPGAPLNVAQGTTALPGYGALAEGPAEPEVAVTNPVKLKGVKTPLLDASDAEREAAIKQREAAAAAAE